MNHDFKRYNQDILEGLLKPGLYILAGPSKVGKSIIATTLANAVACGTQYLGRNTLQGIVVYFDNDNYASQTKHRIEALKLEANDYLIYNFEDARSISSMRNYLYYALDGQLLNLRLVIIDCYANLYDLNDIDRYKDNYSLLKNIANFAMENAICILLIHHTKKGNQNGQDSLLGSRALSAATSGTITIEIDNDFSPQAVLSFNLRHLKERIYIKRDSDAINWILNEDSEIIEEHIDLNVLSIIHTLAKHPEKQLLGSCQEISARINYTENPKGLYRFLERNRDTLADNNVTFNKTRNGQKRQITLILKD